MKILAAAVGNCVHVAGVQAFLELARSLGHTTVFLGPAVTMKRVVASIDQYHPEMVALSYRLSPESAKPLFQELAEELSKNPSLKERVFVFGGTPPVAALARATGLFANVFDGSESAESVLGAFRGTPVERGERPPSEDLVVRIKGSYPMPLIRHHFGLPSLEDTIAGARRIAESAVLDILSIAPDQNAQEFFFRPHEMNPKLDGAGGVPIRSADDLRALYQVTRVGNRPLLRCYSGTTELIKWAKMLKETISIAWGAVPLTWYSELDGRSKRPLKEAIAENQEAIRWYAQNGIPVEVNESHQWALRHSGDTIELATAYLAAYNAKALGVKDYVCQFMFDTPKGISPAMDIAKMFAKLELVESLADSNFRVIRMVRSGLASFSTWSNHAKGQLAASVFAAMALRPHIVHVVGFSEADHAAQPEEIIESCEIARGAIGKAILGTPRPDADPRVAARKAQLLDEARFLVDTIKRLRPGAPGDALTSPEVLTAAVKDGFLDAADLSGVSAAKGKNITAIVDGACVSIDWTTRAPISERDRIKALAVSEEDLDLAEI